MSAVLPQELRALLTLVQSQRKRLVLALLACVLAQAATLVALASGAWLVGQAWAGSHHAALVSGMAVLAGAVLLAAVGRWWQSHASHELAFALIESLQLGIFDGLERAAPARVMGQRTGELASVALSDAQLLEMFYAHMLGDVMGAILVPLLGFLVLAWLHPGLALCWLPLALVLVALPLSGARRAALHATQQAEWQGQMQSDVLEGIQAQRELAALGQQASWLAGMAAKQQRLAQRQGALASRAAWALAAQDAVQALAVLATAGMAAWLVQGHHLAWADVPLAVVVAAAALLPIAELAQAGRQLGAVRASAQRVLAIMQQPARVNDSGDATAPTQSAVAFEQVAFAYRADQPIVQGLSFTANAGECVALSGPSGAGKTTCMQLLLRLMEPDAGVIRIGDVDIQTLPLQTLRQCVAVVPQEVELFDTSVLENIRLGRPEASLAEVQAAAERAQAHAFIMALPDAYQSRCGERGTALSRGQAQRIAIARALLMDSPVVVLDEATASLDAETERAFGQSIAALKAQGRTVILVAHRRSSLRYADRLVRLA